MIQLDSSSAAGFALHNGQVLNETRWPKHLRILFVLSAAFVCWAVPLVLLRLIW